jgi:hypothetical protein
MAFCDQNFFNVKCLNVSSKKRWSGFGSRFWIQILEPRHCFFVVSSILFCILAAEGAPTSGGDPFCSGIHLGEEGVSCYFSYIKNRIKIDELV